MVVVVVVVSVSVGVVGVLETLCVCGGRREDGKGHGMAIPTTPVITARLLGQEASR